MAGVLSKKIDSGKQITWVFDTKPTDNGLSIGAQVGDYIYETTGSHYYVIDASHGAQALSA